MTKDKVEEENKRIHWRKKVILAIILLIAVSGGAQIYFTSRISGQGEEIAKYQLRLNEYEQTIDQLEKELHQTGSLACIEQHAREDLRMVDAHHNVLYIQPEHFAVANP